MKKNIFISFSARYKKSTEKKIKLVEKNVMNEMLKDAVFSVELLTTHQAKTNKIKSQKIIKLLILNLIRSIHNDSDLIITLDNNTLRSHNINPRLFRLIIDKLERMDYIEISRGYFHSEEQSGKRSRISAKNALKNLIIKATTEYTEEATATLIGAKKFKVKDQIKVKLTFQAVDSDKTWSCFRDVEYIQELLEKYGKDGLKNEKFKLQLDSTRIVNII